MSEAEKLQIEAILSEMADEGPSSELFAELESLLRERPDLQQHYAQVILLHTHLAYEFGLLTQRQTRVLPLSQRLEQLIATEAQAITPREEESSEQDTTPLGHIRQAWTRFICIPFARPWAVAALSLLSLGIVGLIWQAHRHQGLPIVDSHLGPNIEWQGDPSHGSEQLVVRDAYALKTLARLSNTTVPTSLALPRARSSSSTNLTLCSGTAWVTRAAKNVDRSVVVALPPQEGMDIYVDTEAEAQNSLSFIELDSHGRANGQTLAFDNLMHDDAAASNRRIGCIGKMSEFNNSRSTRYFLLTSSHISVVENGVSEDWRQSDYRALFESHDMLVIGWDDSGYFADKTAIDDSQRDFNDIRAVIRFHRRKENDSIASQGIGYFPQPSGGRLEFADLAAKCPDDAAYELAVEPGQELLLMISRASREQSFAQVVEVDSQQVVWQMTLSFNLHTPMSVGTYLIKNHGKQVARYRVCVFHANNKDSDANTWQFSTPRLFSKDNASKSIGFQTSPAAPWSDVYIHARWFSDSDGSRSPAIDRRL